MMVLHNFKHWTALLTLATGLLYAQLGFSHHGWGWASSEEFEITGVVTELRLGNPHGELTLDVNGEAWVIEVGQPWRNERVGLTADMLAAGTEITVHGHRSNQEGERLVKAERVVISGKDYNLYPNRPS
ncbi:DUF6152 family protein [Marinobacterium mangrovicola]|uniref:Uncharacterized protein n=1 Tax=Marinobacterium mangrovicola TaxID=1476959 RepID=A0A4R1G842_9GAMM|nr:DUF6152 family protein [Marinobacterium mangrovicola]TCK02645.1 hypothetical protein CLV83_4342 [Marinobacterium mangrovicola]